MDNNIIYKYTTFLIKGLRLILKPGYAITCDIYPYDKGCVINIMFSKGTGSTISIKNEDSLQNIINTLKISDYFGFNDFNNVTFYGTNIIETNNSTIFIKDLNEENWTPTSAGDDIKRLIERK